MNENGAKTEIGTKMQASSKMEGLRCNFMKSCFYNFSCTDVEEYQKRIPTFLSDPKSEFPSESYGHFKRNNKAKKICNTNLLPQFSNLAITFATKIGLSSTLYGWKGNSEGYNFGVLQKSRFGSYHGQKWAKPRVM